MAVRTDHAESIPGQGKTPRASGIMRHGKLAPTLTADELSRADLEQLYLETMRT